ncbi:hypothetical protein BDW74DRAFT_189043 [Aspergillus multicolor]|uniref:Gfo/Idh/MocA family protein n=1 Tax=Aspergillus multicolor TaxID=41759 RepID=UPI003CCD56CA
MTEQIDSGLRIVIIGAGLIGPRHAQSVQRHPLTDLLAFVDPSPSAIPIAESFSVPCYASLAELFHSGDTKAKPDAAIVATPNHTHVDVTIQLLESGIRNILLEKPISDDLDSAERLLATLKAYENAKSNILIGHHRRFNPYVRTTKTLLTTNSLGTIIAVNGLWTLLKPPSYFASPLGSWRADKKKGGVLGINLIHDIDVLQFLFGPISRVYAESTTPQRQSQNPEHTAEEGCAVTLRFKCGIVGTFLICDVTPSPLNFEMGTGENPTIPPVHGSASDCYRVFGTRGSLSVPDMTRWSYDHVSEVGEGGENEKGWNQELGVQRVSVEGGDERPFDRQWEYFIDLLRGKEVDGEAGCSVEDGVRALRVVRAVRESMQGGRPVEVQVA